jgi:hypothetical protein
MSGTCGYQISARMRQKIEGFLELGLGGPTCPLIVFGDKRPAWARTARTTYGPGADDPLCSDTPARADVGLDWSPGHGQNRCSTSMPKPD